MGEGRSSVGILSSRLEINIENKGDIPGVSK